MMTHLLTEHMHLSEGMDAHINTSLSRTREVGRSCDSSHICVSLYAFFFLCKVEVALCAVGTYLKVYSICL